jgi:hypothetical protein
VVQIPRACTNGTTLTEKRRQFQMLSNTKILSPNGTQNTCRMLHAINSDLILNSSVLLGCWCWERFSRTIHISCRIPATCADRQRLLDQRDLGGDLAECYQADNLLLIKQRETSMKIAIPSGYSGIWTTTIYCNCGTHTHILLDGERSMFAMPLDEELQELLSKFEADGIPVKPPSRGGA